VLQDDGFLDLGKLGLDPGVVDVAVGVQLGQRLEALVGAVVVDEPARRLGEEEDEQAQDGGGYVLDGEGDPPLPF